MSSMDSVFERVFERDGELLRRIAFSYLRNEAEAADVVQGAVLRVISAAKASWTEDDVRNVLKAAVRNAAIDLLRRRRRLPHDQLSPEMVSALMVDNSDDLEVALNQIRVSLSATELEILDRNVLGDESLATIAAEKGKKSDSWERDLRKRILRRVQEELPVPRTIPRDGRGAAVRQLCDQIAAMEAGGPSTVVSGTAWIAAVEWVLEMLPSDPNVIHLGRTLFTDSAHFAIPAPERNARRRIALGRRLRRAAIALSNRWIALELYYHEARSWHRLRHLTRTQVVIGLARRYAQRIGDRELVASAAAWALIFNVAPANLRIRIALADESVRSTASFYSSPMLRYIVAAAFELEDVDLAVSYMAELELARGQRSNDEPEDDLAMMSILCGDLCLLRNDAREAFRFYRAAYIIQPAHYDSALCRLVFVLEKLSRPRLADRVFRAVVARKKAASLEAPGFSVWKTDDVYFLARRFLERRDFQSACEVLELRRVSSSAVLFQAWGPQLWPHRARIALAAGYALSELGRTEEARAELDAAIGELETLGHPLLTVAQSLRAKIQTSSLPPTNVDTRNETAT